MRRLVFFCLTTFCFMFFGCSSQQIGLNIASEANVNPDHSGRPSPIVVKMYELKSELAFNQADFKSLFEKPVQTLGADLVAADEITLVPGEAQKIAYQPTPETKFVGIIASFRQMERAHWRVIKPVDPEKGVTIALELNDTSMILLSDEQAEDWNPEEAIKQYQQRTTAATQKTQTAAESTVGSSAENSAGSSAENTLPANSASSPATGATRPSAASVPSGVSAPSGAPAANTPQAPPANSGYITPTAKRL